MRISDWSSDVCSSDLRQHLVGERDAAGHELLRIGVGDRLVVAVEELRLGDPTFPQRRFEGGSHRSGHLLHLADEGAVERKSVVKGKSVEVSVDCGGRRIIKKKN